MQRASGLTWISIAALTVLWNCAGAKGSKDFGLEDLEIEFIDLEMQQGQVSRAQPVLTVTPVLRLTNPNDVPVTFVKVEMQLRGVGELVQLDDNTFPVGRPIPAGGAIEHRINIFATLRGTVGSTFQLSPLHIVGRAYFSSPKGTFSQGFVQLQQVGDS